MVFHTSGTVLKLTDIPFILDWRESIIEINGRRGSMARRAFVRARTIQNIAPDAAQEKRRLNEESHHKNGKQQLTV